MLNKVVSFLELGNLEPAKLIDMTKAFCMSGQHMHPESLKSVVLKLTYLSRDLHIQQAERDEAASMASSLANAAIKSYGQNSEFSRDLVRNIQAILSQPSAA